MLKNKCMTVVIILFVSSLFIYRTIVQRSFAELIIFLFSIAIHELGHILVAYALGDKPKINLAFLGFSLNTEKDFHSVNGVLIYLAGPIANLIFGVLIFLYSMYEYIPKSNFFIFYNALLFSINLIPAYPLDASRVIYSILYNRFGKIKSVKIVCTISYIIGFSILFIGLYIFLVLQNNFLLVMLGCLILTSTKKEFEYAYYFELKTINNSISRTIDR